MKDLSIECAQSYDNSAGNEAAIKDLRETISSAHEADQTSSLVLLVDDISHHDKTFDFDSYANWLRSNGFNPDLVTRESQIKAACNDLLEKIDYSKLPEATSTDLKTDKARYTSPLFIASWCLIRLGHLQIDLFDPDLRSKRVINILPASWKSGEDESLDIIRATPFAAAVDQIDYHFIQE